MEPAAYTVTFSEILLLKKEITNLTLSVRGPSSYARIRRQILTYKDDPCTKRIQIFLMTVIMTHNIDIQMNRKELTKTFIMISN